MRARTWDFNRAGEYRSKHWLAALKNLLKYISGRPGDGYMLVPVESSTGDHSFNRIKHINENFHLDSLQVLSIIPSD